MAPRLTGAMYSTIWNRWTTERRHQRRHHFTCRCRLGRPCKPGTQDSIEHYVCCPVVRDFGRRKLRLQPTQINLHLFTLSQPRNWTKEYATKAALLIYATYRVVHSTSPEQPLTKEQSVDRLETILFRGADGHDRTRDFLDNLFSQHPGDSEQTPPPSFSHKMRRYT